MCASVEAALRELQHSAHDPYRMGGLIGFHEPEERFGVALLSFANQAAAFDRISRSSLSLRLSRRSRVSSSRSAVVSPPSPRPASRSACRTQREIIQLEGPSSRESSWGLRPARTSSTIWRRKSGGYRFCLFAIAVRMCAGVRYFPPCAERLGSRHWPAGVGPPRSTHAPREAIRPDTHRARASSRSDRSGTESATTSRRSVGSKALAHARR